jgi:uncharacterized repeat protein (TIGR03833 family)
VEKQNQRTGTLTEGIVQKLLTNSPTHPHGIKVMLVGGVVGRVKEIIASATVRITTAGQEPWGCLQGRCEIPALRTNLRVRAGLLYDNAGARRFHFNRHFAADCRKLPAHANGFHVVPDVLHDACRGRGMSSIPNAR